MSNTTGTRINRQVRNLTTSGICLALCMVLPFLTGQIQQFGAALSPMHIPVLLCGFLAGPVYAAAVGLLAPILRSTIFGMPPMISPMPIGLAMTFELATYGLMAGMLYKMLPKKNISVYVTLIIAMLSGRVIWGIAMRIIMGFLGMSFTLDAFLAGAFINAVPGIILHIVLIPAIVITLKRAKFLESAHQPGA